MGMIDLEIMIQRVMEITDEKICEGQWEIALHKADMLWNEIGGSEFCKTEMDYEWRFWWAMLAYRYAHLLMNSKNEIENIEKADQLFETVYMEHQHQEGMNYLGTYAGIYRLAALSRLQSLVPKKNNVEDKITEIWTKLADVTQCDKLSRSSNREDRPLHFHYRNMFELASYFIGKSCHAFSGRDTFCGLPFSGYSSSNAYRLVFSDRNNNMIRYPKKIAKEIALGYKNAIVYQIDQKSQGPGKWISSSQPNSSHTISTPPAYTLMMLTWVLYNPDDRLFPTEGNYARRIKNLLKIELQKFANCQEPLTTNHGQVVKLQNYPLKIIGIVHDGIFPTLYDSIPRT